MGEPKRHRFVPPPAPCRASLSEALLADEGMLLVALIERARCSEGEQHEIARLAEQLVHAARAGRRESGGVDSFLH